MKNFNSPLSVFWLRRDLRLADNRAFSKACSLSQKVALVFVFDTEILKKLPTNTDPRVNFIFSSLEELHREIQKRGSQIILRFGNPVEEIPQVVHSLKAHALFFNEDYEPYAQKRDEKISKMLESQGVAIHASKDQVIFTGLEVSKPNRSAYQIFTPYKKAWLKKFQKKDIEKSRITEAQLRDALVDAKKIDPLTRSWDLRTLGFQPTWKPYYGFQKPGRKSALECLKRFSKKIHLYDKNRDFPSDLQGTSGLSIHLRFGTVSIRECVALTQGQSSLGHQVWLSELIWRDFYSMILSQFPHVESRSFKSSCDSIVWPSPETSFQSWCEGQTGFPIVDAGLRQLNETGWMHNRVRMITASFLCKDLLVDWRKGQDYFAQKLLDFDLASNNGGWQWSASTGCDAQPYFRIFNPSLQSQKFDPQAMYIKKWVPELKNCTPQDIHNPEESCLSSQTKYPPPIVKHRDQKPKVLELFKSANGNL